MTEKPRFTKTPTGYLMVLTQGDDVLGHLTQLAKRETIPSASFFGLGFAGKVVFGFFDFERKAYSPKAFTDVEIVSFSGSLAWGDGEQPSLHAHATASDETFAAVGGHVLELVVGKGSMEVTNMLSLRKL